MALTKLGDPDAAADGRLETFPIDEPGLELVLDCGEFTCRCPVTGQPEWATIEIAETGGERGVETKSLKLEVETLGEVGIVDDVGRDVGSDARLHRRVAVGLVDGLADVLPQPVVVDRAAAGFLLVLDQGAVHDHLGQREQGVDPGVGRQRGAHALAQVQLATLVAGQLGVAVEAAPDMAVAIHLEDVAVLAIDDQAADGPLGTVVELQDRGRVAAPDQLLHAGGHHRLTAQ